MTTTHSISRHATTNVLHAFDYAKIIGRPLNCYVVICCDEIGSGKTASEICQDLRDRYRDWNLNAAKRYSLEVTPPTYVQTIENPSGTNPHANWVVHIPPVLFGEFLKKLPMWLKRAQGSVRLMDISVQEVAEETDKTLAKYVIKGADDHYVEYFGLDDFAAPQGLVWGRRTCVSPSIGRTARREAGFIPKYHRKKFKLSDVQEARRAPRKMFVNSGAPERLTAAQKARLRAWEGVPSFVRAPSRRKGGENTQNGGESRRAGTPPVSSSSSSGSSPAM